MRLRCVRKTVAMDRRTEDSLAERLERVRGHRLEALARCRVVEQHRRRDRRRLGTQRRGVDRCMCTARLAMQDPVAERLRARAGSRHAQVRRDHRRSRPRRGRRSPPARHPRTRRPRRRSPRRSRSRERCAPSPRSTPCRSRARPAPCPTRTGTFRHLRPRRAPAPCRRAARDAFDAADTRRSIPSASAWRRSGHRRRRGARSRARREPCERRRRRPAAARRTRRGHPEAGARRRHRHRSPSRRPPCPAARAARASGSVRYERRRR